PPESIKGPILRECRAKAQRRKDRGCESIAWWELGWHSANVSSLSKSSLSGRQLSSRTNKSSPTPTWQTSYLAFCAVLERLDGERPLRLGVLARDLTYARTSQASPLPLVLLCLCGRPSWRARFPDDHARANCLHSATG